MITKEEAIETITEAYKLVNEGYNIHKKIMADTSEPETSEEAFGALARMASSISGINNSKRLLFDLAKEICGEEDKERFQELKDIFRCAVFHAQEIDAGVEGALMVMDILCKPEERIWL